MKKIYVHTQSVASDTWAITHTVAQVPIIDVVLSTGEKVLPSSVVVTGADTIEVRFTSPRTGTATLVGRGNYPTWTAAPYVPIVPEPGPSISIGIVVFSDYNEDRSFEARFAREGIDTLAGGEVDWAFTANGYTLAFDENAGQDVGAGAYLVTNGDNLADPFNFNETSSGLVVYGGGAGGNFETLATAITSVGQNRTTYGAEATFATMYDETKRSYDTFIPAAGLTQILFVPIDPLYAETDLYIDVLVDSAYSYPGVYVYTDDIDPNTTLPYERIDMTYSVAPVFPVNGDGTHRNVFRVSFSDHGIVGPLNITGILITGSNQYPQNQPRRIFGIYADVFEHATSGTIVFGARQGFVVKTGSYVGPLTAPAVSTITLSNPVDEYSGDPLAPVPNSGVLGVPSVVDFTHSAETI